MQETAQPRASTYNRYYKQIQEAVAKPRTRAYTMIVFSLFAMSLMAWFAIRPTIQTILYLRKEIEDDMIVNKRMDEKIASLIQAQADYNSLKPRLAVLASALPNDPDALSLVTELRNIATNTNLAISSLTFSDVPLANNSSSSASANSDTASREEGNTSQEATTAAQEQGNTNQATAEPVETLTVSGILEGPYENIRSYLESLKNMRRITSVELLKIDPGSGTTSAASGSGNLLQLTLQLNAYYTLNQ